MTQIYVLFLASSLTSSRFSRISRDRIESVVVLRLPESRCSSFEGLRATADFEEFPELQYSFEYTSSYVSSIIQDGIGIRILFRLFVILFTLTAHFILELLHITIEFIIFLLTIGSPYAVTSKW
ncbi:hypothetical protein V1477_000853 [Vespula maculifrons]|uniref:Uncharacterized protein n=1 Tax=Vespula maculifrons TaxID=7453 RepID=A0ABD2D047_VESMC